MKKLPDLHLISQFLSVVDSPSMAALARELGVSTAAVSQSISKLEKNFGVPLLERGIRRNRMTPAGAVLRERARHLLTILEDLIEELDEYKDTDIPHLRIYIIESLARSLVPSLVMNLGDKVKDLAIETRYRFDVVGDLLNDTFDMVISSETLTDAGVESIPLGKERLIALFPRAARHLTFGELAQSLPFLRFNRFDRFNAKLTQLLESRNLKPARTFECTSLPAVAELINNGFGWAIATPLRVRHLLPLYSDIAASVFADPCCERELYLLVHKERFLDLPEVTARLCREALARDAQSWMETLGDEGLQPIEVWPKRESGDFGAGLRVPAETQRRESGFAGKAKPSRNARLRRPASSLEEPVVAPVGRRK